MTQAESVTMSKLSLYEISDKSSDPEKTIRNCVGFCVFSKKLKGSLLQRQARKLLNRELFAIQRIGLLRSETRALDSFLYKGIAGSVEK